MADRNLEIKITAKDQTRSGLDSSKRSLQGFASAASSILGVGLGVESIRRLTTATVEASMAMERIESRFKAVTGSSASAKREFAFAASESQRLGLNLQFAAENYASLTAAANGTELAGQGVRNIFSAVSEASAVLGLATDQTTGALRAIEQMMSKGNVQAEELRGQLGERLPGAFNIAARAMGVSTEELNKMLDRGEVVASEFLPKFADELRKTYQGEIPKSQRAVNLFNTELFELKNTIGGVGVNDTVIWAIDNTTGVMRGLNFMIRDTTEWVRELTDGLEAAGGAFETFLKTTPGVGTALSLAEVIQGYGELRAGQEAGKVRGAIPGTYNPKTGKYDPTTLDPVTVKGKSTLTDKELDDADRRRFELRMFTMEQENARREEMEAATLERLRREAGEEQALLDQRFEYKMMVMEAENAAREEQEAMTLERLRREHQEEMVLAEAKRAIWSDSANFFMNISNAMYVFGGKKSRKLFELNKAAGIAEATIDTFVAANKALKNPPGPPWTIPLAAAVTAQGLARVAAISSTSFGSGAVAAGGFGGGTPDSPVVTQPSTGDNAQGNVTIILNNPIGERRWFEENLPDVLQDFSTRKIEIGYQPRAN